MEVVEAMVGPVDSLAGPGQEALDGLFGPTALGFDCLSLKLHRQLPRAYCSPFHLLPQRLRTQPNSTDRADSLGEVALQGLVGALRCC